MLQSKKISRLLSQGLTAIPDDSESSSTSPIVTRANAPLSISLLSHEGIPLTTVLNKSVLQETSIVPDNLRVYSLQSYKTLIQHQHQQAEKPVLKNWDIIELDAGLKSIIMSLNVEENDSSNPESVVVGEEAGVETLVESAGSSQDNELYIVLFYLKPFPDAIAKLKLDHIDAALHEGLKGYVRG
ncbi:predicted protein [Scheffersomyces stipitis CBS 6054]|uniref:Uncharacterized protein n=1 Tax=Scheffersomyces stipitis (strain ATCC 58785 / CBS 6054 / NBRC 10063 / NRRL Y-11545) TaxID=322104 RepID=A3LY38_PICST|nr:predicted protein [Scheffersomyces stipitis CBS 6054]ABN67910.2 predicted protein [Scheffersomyces stipitis CBS 6054]KAG2732070.1 hypothetical protein G9P44_004487 [Scheffersomyces stipitis]